jgi:adenosylcobinamide-phosphate synthase
MTEAVAPPFVAVLVLVAALLLDYGIGDPWHWPHPVRLMGWVIQTGSDGILRRELSSTQQRWAGVGLGLGVILGSGVVAWGVVYLATVTHPLLGIAVQSIMLASCLAARSLRAAAEDVLAAIAPSAAAVAVGPTAPNLALARQRLAQYVGRDTDHLPYREILRAVLETVTENATDGATAPLFYGLVGSFLPGIGGVPLAFSYKAASTLDSMIGYRRKPFTDIGWFSARLEDGLTWLPCRLTVLTVALLSRRPRRVLMLCRRDATADPSPNAGWSECAYAAALDVQVGGTNYYQGQVKPKPLLAEANQPITPERVERAMRLTRWCLWLWSGVAIALLILLSIVRPVG